MGGCPDTRDLVGVYTTGWSVYELKHGIKKGGGTS